MASFGKKPDLETKTPAKWRPSMDTPLPSLPCSQATTTGKPCPNPSIPGSDKCASHATNLDKKTAQDRVEEARLRMVGLVTPAIDALEELLDAGTAENVRLKAATEILDRAGIVKGQEITVTHIEDNRSAEMVKEKLAAIHARQQADAVREAEDVIEVVEEEQ